MDIKSMIINNYKVYVSTDVTFYESVFPFHDVIASLNSIHLRIVQETNVNQPDTHDINIVYFTPLYSIGQLIHANNNAPIRRSSQERNPPLG